MQFLHTMVRVHDLNKSLHFYCEQLGLVEMYRSEHEKGRFTLVFLAAPEDVELAKQRKAPMLELTYNWPDETGNSETYSGGRNFGHLAFRVENIYLTCERLLKNGTKILRPPRDGQMAFVKSPEGISIELLQKGEHLAPQQPWIDMANQGSW